MVDSTVVDMDVVRTMLAQSRRLNRASAQRLRASRRSLGDSNYKLAMSLDVLAALGRRRRLCGGSDVVERLGERLECAACRKPFESTDSFVYSTASREIRHLACHDTPSVADVPVNPPPPSESR